MGLLYLDECYFHPSRQYASESIKELAYKAMEYLWNKTELRVEASVFSREQIRHKLLNEMMPEILDRAIEIYMQAQNVRQELQFLASCIFRTLIGYNAYIDRLYRQNNS